MEVEEAGHTHKRMHARKPYMHARARARVCARTRVACAQECQTNNCCRAAMDIRSARTFVGAWLEGCALPPTAVMGLMRPIDWPRRGPEHVSGAPT